MPPLSPLRPPPQLKKSPFIWPPTLTRVSSPLAQKSRCHRSHPFAPVSCLITCSRNMLFLAPSTPSRAAQPSMTSSYLPTPQTLGRVASRLSISAAPLSTTTPPASSPNCSRSTPSSAPCTPLCLTAPRFASSSTVSLTTPLPAMPALPGLTLSSTPPRVPQRPASPPPSHENHRRLRLRLWRSHRPSRSPAPHPRRPIHISRRYRAPPLRLKVP